MDSRDRAHPTNQASGPADLALKYQDLGPAGMEPAGALLVFCHTTNATFDVMGVLGMSLGVLLWSLVMTLRDGGTRLIGACGLFIGTAVPAVLISGHLAMTLHGTGAFLLAQVAWTIATATQLIRGQI